MNQENIKNKNSKHIILAYKFEIREQQYPSLISNLNELFLILQKESQNIIQNHQIQLESFSEIEYENKFKGHFYKKLSQLTNKNYLNFDYPQKSRLFKFISEAFRKNFKSLLYKQKIAYILEKHNWNIEEDKEKIREELSGLNLFPTLVEIKNLCRSKLIPQKENFSFINLEGEEEQGLLIPIDYSSCDSQIIKQLDHLLPNYDIVFKNGIYHFEAILPYFIKQKLEKNEIEKFCKPKFQLIDGKWFCVISYFLNKISKNSKDLKTSKDVKSMGIDLGIVKNYSGSVVEFLENEKDIKNLTANEKLKTFSLKISKVKNINKNQDLLSSKESYHLLRKIKRIKGNLEAVYKKIEFYNKLIEGIKNKQKSIVFNGKIVRIKDNILILESKRKRLLKEKQFLSKKISNVKKHKAYCVARDIIRQIGIYKVDVVVLEKLNWMESKGGRWDFSQQQEIIERKILEKTTAQAIKVNPSYSSSSNPYLEDYLNDQKIERGIGKGRMIKFKNFEIDRDFLASINLGNRGLEKLKNKKEQGNILVLSKK